MEIIVVVVLLGIITSFALPNYQKSVRKAHERDAIVQLTSLYAANLMYNAQDGAYLPGSPVRNLASINSGLGINIIANGMTYTYAAAASAAVTFTARAFWDESGTANDFTIRVNERAINPNAVSPNRNPCCATAGKCPSLGDC